MIVGRVYAVIFFLFKRKTAYEMRISDWSSDVCSSDLSFATHAAAANSAAAGAAMAIDGGTDPGFAIGAAKLRANIAAGIGTDIAHQVHGAIGFTQEFALQRFTRRLWSWRSEYGEDAH